MDRQPIFFAWTRSFWTAVLTALLVIDETGEPIVRALSALAAPLVGLDSEVTTQFGLDVLPLLTLLITVQQRMHAARPYTTDPRALR